MFTMKFIRGLLIIFFFFLPAVHAESPGTSAANFLKIGAGARGAAMGEAQSAIADDVSAAYYNPAGLTGLRYQELMLMHYELAQDVRYQQASFGTPTENWGSLAGGVSYLDYGNIQGYDSNSLPTSNVKANNLLISGSWAKKIIQNSNLSTGVSLKYLDSNLAGYKASAPMLDLGILFPFDTAKLKGLRVAAAIRNIGPDIKYNAEGSPLPQQMVLGSGLSALGGNLNIALDFIKPKDNSSYFSTGIEYRIFEILNLRVGYSGKSNFIGSGVSYGMGLKFNQWNLDYALVPLGDLGTTNRLSVGIRFGRAMQMKDASDQIENAYHRAERQVALGQSVEAYSTLNDLLLIAPWHKPSVELKAKIEKQFAEMSVSKNRARMDAEIADKFTEAKAAFDRDELVPAKKGFDTILALQPDHVGSKVYLDRIKNRYASLAQESFKLGMDYFAAGDYPKAKLAFEKTLTIDDTHADAKAQLAKTNEMILDSSKRAEEMKKLAGAEGAYKAGLASYQKNNLEDALKSFEEVKALVPEYEEVGRYLDLTKKTLANVLFEESKVHVDNGQLEPAVAKLKRAIELNPSDTRLQSALDMASRDLAGKNAQESKKFYQDGLDAYLNGNTEKASKNWRHALELDSSNEEAQKALSKLDEQKKYEHPNQAQ
jgi:tetratricopeptide (TPR) repeat protein